MTEIRCIAIGTGAGEAPGLNAVIRTVVKSAILKYNWKVIGIPDGFDGLIWPERALRTNFEERQRHPASQRHHSGYDQPRQPLQVSEAGKRLGGGARHCRWRIRQKGFPEGAGTPRRCVSG